MTTLQDALAQQGEPVFWWDGDRSSVQDSFDFKQSATYKIPLYTAAPAPQPAQGFDEWWDSQANTPAPDTFKRWEHSCRMAWKAALQSAQPVAPLTDEQIKSMWAQYCGYPGGILDFARAVREVK